MGRLLIFLSGAQPDILTDVRVDRPKYEGVGFTILFTGILACASMSFALYTALGAPLGLAVAAGVVWGVLIMGLDRMLVVSMPRGHGLRNALLVILPRLLLALLLSIVISTPLVLEIFRPDIDQQIGVIHQEQVEAAAGAAQNDKLGQQITDLETTIKNLTEELTQPPNLTSLTQEYQNEENAAQAAYTQWQCQLYGVPGCVPGNGPKAKTAENAYLTDLKNANATQRRIQNLESPTAAQDIQLQITTDQGQLRADQAAQAKAIASANQATLADNGLLIRLEALGQVAARNTTVQVARWLLFLLFVVIECMPVLSKVLLNAIGETTYDQALDYDKDIQLQVRRTMSDDKLLDADSIIAERGRIRAAAANREATTASRAWRPRWPFGRAQRGPAPSAPGPPWPGPRPARPPRAHRRGNYAFWRRRRTAGSWPAWASVPPGAGDQSANGSRLPPVFLREPVPGSPADGQQGGTP